MFRYINLSPFVKSSAYKLPKTRQCPSQSFISLPKMGKGMSLVCDVFEFVGKCSDKCQKIFKK